MERRKNIIISVDDFGLNDMANRKILDMAKRGKIDRVAFMAYGRFNKEEVKALLLTGVKLDIHLHLERMKPDAFENRGLNQNIMKRITDFLGIFLGRGNIDEIRKEWQEQIDEFVRVFGRNPDGINSHEHIHYFPPYFRLALEIQRKLNASHFRLGKEGIVGGTLTATILKFLSCLDRKILRSRKVTVPTTRYFTSYEWIRNPKKFFENISDDRSVEILFHPMKDEEFQYIRENL